MAEIKKISTELQLLDKFLDTSGDAGTSGQVLTSTGTGINWVSGGSLPGGPYLPLSAGSTKPLTGNLYINDSIPKLIFTDTDTSTVASISANSSNLTYTTVTSARDHIFKAGTDTLVTIEGAGNVGIGTTSPGQKLDVSGNIASNSIYLYDSTSNDRLVLDLDGSDNLQISTGTSTGSRGITFFTESSEKMRILSGGNVGIGTTSPGAKLHVDDSVGGKLRLSNISATADGEKIGGIETGVANGTFFAGVNFFRHDANDGEIRFRTKVNNTNTDVMAIVDGNVGVGTTSPSANLDILNGTTGASLKLSATATAYWQLQRNPTTGNLNISDDALGNVMSFDQSSGNVGIGTTNPTNKLHIQGSQATVYSSTDSGGQASTGTTINNTNTAGSGETFSQLLFTVGTNNNSVSRIVAIRSGSDASDLAFVGKSAAGVAEYMRIKSGGNVGIGTTSPGSSLEVLKSASSTTISEARISSLVTGGYGGQANLWLRTSVYGSAMLAFGPQVGSSTVASSASGKISYNTFTRVFTVTADSNALLTLGGSLDRVGINQTSPLYTLDVTGNGRFTSTVTATNFINSSDKRLKENIEEVCNNNVEVSWKTFNFKTEKEQKRYGVIAQELEKTNPEFVREDSQGFKSVAYIDLLIAKIAELEARIQKLEK